MSILARVFRLFAALCAGGLLLAPPGAALADSARSFDIPAQPLSQALVAFSEQSKLVVTAATIVLAGKQAPQVKGTMAPEEALRLLLEGTGLKYSKGSGGEVTILEASRAAGGEELKLARRETDQSQTMQKVKTSGEVAGVQEEQSTEEAVVTVTGTRIRGVKNLPAPSVTITRDDIEKTGYVNLQQVFETLPQNFDEISIDGYYATEGGSQLAAQNRFDRASGVDLRGLGAGSTLTLVNGSRRAGSLGGRVVDISAIPLAVVDRVEVVTGGRSAVYGSDAVAGVVNIVTRQDFAGAESQLSYGGADIGAERLQFSQIVGGRFAHGGVVAAYDYGREWPLNLVETGLMADPSSWGVINIRTEQQTEGTRHTAYLSGHFALSEHIELQGEGLYTNKDYEGHNRNRSLNPGVMQDSTDFFKHSSDQYSLQASANVDLPNSWALKVNGGTSVTENLLDFSGYLDLGFFAFPNEIIIDTKTEVSSLAAVVDGTLFSIAGLTPRTAIGVEVRGEDYNSITPTGSNTSDGVRDRTIRSAFAELLVPFADNTLELSIAGRYDEYSDFGDTFNPQYGVVWRAARGLALRGAYSTAFRAPTLFEGSDQAFATMGNRTDPVTGGLSPVLFWRGQNPNLGPEEAKTWSAGVDYEPEFASWIRLSASYFEVNYEDRIDTPAFNSDLGTILLQEERYGDFIDRNPSAALIEAMFDSLHGRFLGNSTGRTYDSSNRDPAVLLAVFPDLIVFDNRAQNTAISDINGIDFNANGRWSTAAGLVSVGVNAAYTLNYKRKLTLTSPAFNNLNEVGKPVDLRVRSNAGLSRGSLGVYFQVNYVDSYRDPFSFVTPTAGGRMDSWTTVDATFRFNGSDTDGIWEGFSAALSIDNLLDQDPPEYLNSFSDLRYDAANASPLGRYVTVRIVKRW